ncbi:MAG: ferritin, partial [Candidatus Omnitrophica bacterium]|nr:ferritin [Candidatus Omnitrophota bacterium]
MDKKLHSALNEQIKNELYSAYLYLSMASWFESVNLEGVAHWMKV